MFMKWWLGEVKRYRVLDATDNAATNLKFESTTLQIYTVPAGKRWLFMGGAVYRDTSSTLIGYLTDSTGAVLQRFINEGAGTGYTEYPEITGGAGGYTALWPLIIDEGEKVNIQFGTAQSTGAWITCMVVEIDV